MPYEFLNQLLLCPLFANRNRLWIRDDYFLEMKDVVSIDMISISDLAYWNLYGWSCY
jgi:hypothetical protein